MTVIDHFRAHLQQINTQALAAPLPHLADEMAKTTRQLQKEYGDIRQGNQDPQGIQSAVLDYLATGELAGYRQTKYVCFGIATYYGNGGCPLENTPLFAKLIAYVDSLQTEPRKFRRCYQGLLNGYFHYRTSELKPSGKKNWLQLREFLAHHRPVLAKHKPVVLWVQILAQHRNLLKDEPCKPYAKDLLAGDVAVVDELKSNLGINGDSWVMDELVLAPIRVATGFTDDAFKQKLPILLALLDKQALLASAGLVLLLQRYRICRERPEHPGLRDLALREWKSPWLEAHKPLWLAQVGEPVMAMVKLWLTKQYIKDFFELLQSDRQADRERMEFWLQYAEAIEDFWLAMGNNSFRNPHKDYQRIREQLASQLMRLDGNNQNDDNAFLMKIGGYVFIEFGRANNACHVFLANNLPFQSGQTYISGTTSGLKNTRHPGHCKKLLHNAGWQYTFAEFLRDHASAMLKPKTDLKQTKYSKLFNESEVKTSSRHLNELLSLCETYGITIDDRRDFAGALWIQAPKNGGLADLLTKAGFRYREDKGWWLDG